MVLITVKEDNFLDEQQWATDTHFAMTQYSFKRAFKLCPGQVEGAVGIELKQLHSRKAFAPQGAPNTRPAEEDGPRINYVGRREAR